MGFFRNLFRRRSQTTPAETHAASSDDATSTPHVPDASETAQIVSAPSSEKAPTSDSDAAWWESSTPAPSADGSKDSYPDLVPELLVPSPALSEDDLQIDLAIAEGEASSTAVERQYGTAPLPSIDDDDQDIVDASQQQALHRIEHDATRELGYQEEPVTALRPSIQGLAAAALRDVGRVRQINQDSVFSLLATLPRAGGDVPIGLFIVADGMGGHDGGEIASQLAVSSVARYILGQIVVPALDENPMEALQPIMIEAVKEANRTIWDRAQQDGSDMGTTCTAVLMLGSALYIGHVGDSRAYVCEPDGMRLLTNDHSAVGRLIQLGQLDASEARDHPLRSQLYRTVGQHPNLQVDFIYHHIGKASHLVIGSDGMWGMVDEARMEETLRTYLWPQDVCRELVSLANLAGGDDNISAVVVSFPLAERTTA
jgi:serine/threonine protein phosphatase PrpC